MTSVESVLSTLAEERQTVASRLDAIDLAIDNLKRVYPPMPAAPMRKSKPRAVVTKVKAARAKPVRETLGDAVQAEPRRAALLKCLRLNSGVATTKQLRAAMPNEPDLSEDQRRAALSNTLTRLKSKGLIDRTGDTWSLVGQGSEK